MTGDRASAGIIYLWRGPTQLRGLPLSPNSQAAGRAGGSGYPLRRGEDRPVTVMRATPACETFKPSTRGVIFSQRVGPEGARATQFRHVCDTWSEVDLASCHRPSVWDCAPILSFGPKGSLLPICQTAGGISGNLVHARKGVQPGNEQPLAPDSMCAICRRISALYQKQEAISDDGFASSSQLPGYEQDTTTYLRYHVYLRTRRERVE